MFKFFFFWGIESEIESQAKQSLHHPDVCVTLLHAPVLSISARCTIQPVLWQLCRHAILANQIMIDILSSLTQLITCVVLFSATNILPICIFICVFLCLWYIGVELD